MVKLGKAFGDMLIQESRVRKSPLNFFLEKEEKEVSSSPFLIILFFFFLVLVVRLFYLQILSGRHFRELSDNNRIQIVKTPSLRGIIYDRHGQALVRNVPTYQLKDPKTGKLRVIEREEALLKELKNDDSDLIIRPAREYIYSSKTSHLLGYLGEVNSEEIKDFKKQSKCQASGNQGIDNYEIGDFIGRGGVEEAYDCQLRGIDGKRLVETDTYGKFLRQLGKVEPIAGERLNLTIDLSLQTIAEKELIGKKGAVVCQNPQTGEILALYSSPAFDPNVFTKKILGESSTATSKILNDQENTPLINRAISGTYPSGSTFKLIVATAALEDKKITQNTLFEDTGILTVGKWSFANWLFLKRGEKEGFINIVHAIKRSNDVFFYKLGEKVGVERINFWAKKFGLGKPLGIDLPGEEAGVIPNQKWKKENIGEDWYLGDTYHLSIGQGYLLVTPLQVNSWTSVIANGGKLCKPTVIKSKINPSTSFDKAQDKSLRTGNQKSKIPFDFAQGKQIKNQKEETGNCKNLNIRPETIKLITEGMKQACQPGGTGYPLFDFKMNGKKIPVACKTGTAEFGDPKNDTHAWFTAFAPVDNPEIVVTVLVERGGEGSDVAAPIAKKILEEWFRER